MRQFITTLRIITNPRVLVATWRAFRWRHEAVRQNTHSPAQIAPKDRWQRLRAWKHLFQWLNRERVTRHQGRWVINSLLPTFPSSAYDRTLERLLGQRQLFPQTAFLAVTADCPADCSYCSMKGRNVGQLLSTKQWCDVINQLHGLGTSLIALTGGEPLKRHDLPELIHAAHQSGMEVQLFTSGVGLTQARIETLRDAGLWAFGVSLDRTDQDTVDRICSIPGAFEAAVAALEMSKRAGLYTFINAVADRQMVVSGEYRRLHDLARRLKLHELRLIEISSCGHTQTNECRTLLQPEHVAELRRFHREVNRRGRLPKIVAFSEIESPEMFGCVAGTLHLFIDPAGDVCPCNFTPLSFGNVLTEPLETIWRRMSIAMRQPRRYCFVQTNGEIVQRQADGNGFPLPKELSCRIAAEAREDGLPDYFAVVTTPFGFP